MSRTEQCDRKLLLSFRSAALSRKESPSQGTHSIEIVPEFVANLTVAAKQNCGAVSVIVPDGSFRVVPTGVTVSWCVHTRRPGHLS